MDTLGRIEDGPMSRRYGLMNRKSHLRPTRNGKMSMTSDEKDN
jgi:hypothetical protein